MMDEPFRLSCSPDGVIAHDAWRRVWAIILARAVNGGIVLVSGPPGAGKSLLLREAARVLSAQGLSTSLIAHGSAPAFGWSFDVVLVDEAQRLSDDELECLGASRSAIVLAALPDFATRLSRFAGPIEVATLDPLPPEQAARFIAASLQTAGHPRDTFEPEAVLALALRSSGLPRMINILASASLFVAQLDGSKRVSQQHVEQAASLRDGDELLAGLAGETLASRPALRPSSVDTPLRWCTAARLRRPGAHAAGVVAATGIALAFFGVWTAALRTERSPPERPQNSLVVASGADVATSAKLSGGAPAETSGPAVAPVLPPPVPLDVLPPSLPTSAVRPPSGPPLAGPPLAGVSDDAVGAYQGSIFNVTMRQGGRVRLLIQRDGSEGAVIARFEASAGLLGSGKLSGRISSDGRLAVSGQLMMGSNPFRCDLTGVVKGDTLKGSANFVRTSGGDVYVSEFSLNRSS